MSLKGGVALALGLAGVLIALPAPVALAQVAEAPVCGGPDLTAAPRLFVTAETGFRYRGPGLAVGSGEMAIGITALSAEGFGQVLVQRLSLDGLPLGSPRDVRNSSTRGGGGDPALVWDGEGYGVAWSDSSSANVVLTLLKKNKVTPLAQFPESSISLATPALAWSGSQYGLAWLHYPGVNTTMQLLFARVASDGTILAGPSVIASAGALSFPRLAAWPGGFGLVWVDVTHDELHFRALGADGAFVGESILAREDVMVPDVTWIGDRYGVAWHDSAIAVVGVVAPDATILSQQRVFSFPFLGTTPAITVGWTGAEMMVAMGIQDHPASILIRRVSVSGEPIQREIRIPHATDNDVKTVGDLVWTGSRFALAWTYPLHDPTQDWVGLIDCDCPDADQDAFSVCNGDCLDSDSATYPGGIEICDGHDNDCDGTTDEGLNDLTTCGTGPCRRTVPACQNGAPGLCVPGPPSSETCNGIDDDCDDVIDDRDVDGDGASDCDADCGPGDPSIHPGAFELCNGVDDDCNGLVDDRGGTVDGDGDGLVGACDNCPAIANAGQADMDLDGVGDVCDNCPMVGNASQSDDDRDGAGDACDLCPGIAGPNTDADGDGLGAACDNCPNVANPGQEESDFDPYGDACDRCPGMSNASNDDLDADTLGDLCDNCPFNGNLDQSDTDDDDEGDACDLNDGLLMVWVTAPDQVEWDPEPAFILYDVYRGDLDRLKATGESTQDPETVPLAGQFCDVTDSFLLDDPPPVGRGVFYLVAVTTSSGDQGIGDDSAGHPRLNAHPCP